MVNQAPVGGNGCDGVADGMNRINLTSNSNTQFEESTFQVKHERVKPSGTNGGVLSGSLEEFNKQSTGVNNRITSQTPSNKKNDRSHSESEKINTKEVFVNCIKETLKQWFTQSTYQYLNINTSRNMENDIEIEGTQCTY